MSVTLSYEELAKIKKLKANGFGPTKSSLMIFDYTPKQLEMMRTGMGISKREVAEFFGVTEPTIKYWESGRTKSQIIYWMYGIFLERYYAEIKGYVPAFRKIGGGTFKMEEELFNGI